MKPKTIIPLIIGLGVGFFAIKMGLDMVAKAKGASAQEAVVFVTAKPIEVATRITDSMLTSKKVAAGLAPSDAFTDKSALVGRVTAMSLAPGVPITSGMLAPAGAEPGLRAIIPAGHRAVSVSVTEESSVAGFIMPGSRVDVSTVCEKNQTSRLILTDVEVGAVGQSLSEVGADGKTTRISKSVTLFLEPHEVQVLNAHSGTRNKVRLALRGNSDDPQESFWSDVLNNAMKNKVATKPQAIQPEGAKTHVVEVVHGTEMERLVFDERGVRQFRDEPDSPAHRSSRSETIE